MQVYWTDAPASEGGDGPQNESGMWDGCDHWKLLALLPASLVTRISPSSIYTAIYAAIQQTWHLEVSVTVNARDGGLEAQKRRRSFLLEVWRRKSAAGPFCSEHLEHTTAYMF